MTRAITAIAGRVEAYSAALGAGSHLGRRRGVVSLRACRRRRRARPTPRRRRRLRAHLRAPLAVRARGQSASRAGAGPPDMTADVDRYLVRWRCGRCGHVFNAQKWIQALASGEAAKNVRAPRTPCNTPAAPSAARCRWRERGSATRTSRPPSRTAGRFGSSTPRGRPARRAPGGP